MCFRTKCSTINWDDRIGLQTKWTHVEKGWQVLVFVFCLLCLSSSCLCRCLAFVCLDFTAELRRGMAGDSPCLCPVLSLACISFLPCLVVVFLFCPVLSLFVALFALPCSLSFLTCLIGFFCVLFFVYSMSSCFFVCGLAFCCRRLSSLVVVFCLIAYASLPAPNKSTSIYVSMSSFVWSCVVLSSF
jgi:hypothetical protein